MVISFKVNGGPVSVDAPQDTPLLWVIREGLKLTGTKFGCRVGLCGACMVHIDGKRAFSCQTQISEVSARELLILARPLSMFRVRIASLSPTRGVSRTL